MNTQECDGVMARLYAIWPKKIEATEVMEWVDYLMPLDHDAALRACSDLRMEKQWRPSIAEFNVAYVAALHRLDGRGLPSGDKRNEDDLRGEYGASVSEWVYCPNCLMAISLIERDTTAVYWEGRGLCHLDCPVPGSAPKMPRPEQLTRGLEG